MYKHPLTSKIHKELDNALLKAHLRSGIVPPVHTFQPSELELALVFFSADLARQVRLRNSVLNPLRILHMRTCIGPSLRDMLLESRQYVARREALVLNE